jgi:hypothetical protein
MGMGKGPPQPKPVVAGIDEIDVATNQTNVPPPYFAGARRFNVSWIMTPIVTRIVAQNQGGKKG